MSRGGQLTFVVIRLSSMSFSVIGLHTHQYTRCVTCIPDHSLEFGSPLKKGTVNCVFYCRGNLVPRSIRHAQIQDCSGKDKLCGDTTMFTGKRDLPIVILGQFFGFGQSRLYPRWEKVGFTDGVQSYPLLSEQTSTGCESSVRCHHHGKGQRIHAPMIAKVQEPGFG